LIRDAGRRGLVAAAPAIVAATRAAIARATRDRSNLMNTETQVIEAAVAALVALGLDADPAVAVLFDEMLRHPNIHVKWDLLRAAPSDPRLVPGMFHVLDEKWGWQESTARAWLAPWKGTPVYEAARRK
jgi:hypothetical protein